MIKHAQSHGNNLHQKYLSVVKAQEVILGNYKTSDISFCKPRMLDPKIQPFFEDWKAQQKASQPLCLLDFEASCDIIKDNEFASEKVPSFYLDEEYVELCNKYHIPYRAVYHSYRELDATEELVADYVYLLKSAKNLCIYWDVSTFDFEGLQCAIEEARSEETDHDHFADLRSDLWAYYSNTGVL